ncbi:MAG: PaaI family thioesterase [Deltaproteobacteria bacterium]|nr:MAG: PaaI family thioesterase [Deltaproteobacteria bacterium]
MASFPEETIALLNAVAGGYDRVIGLRYVSATPTECVAEIEVGDAHRQPYGLVHGGVYAGMIESVCSAGAALHVMAEGKSTVGLENSTSFLRAVRSGTLRCTARPAFLGRRTHLWEAEIHDSTGRLVATGRVRMIVLEADAKAAGERIDIAHPTESAPKEGE